MLFYVLNIIFLASFLASYNTTYLNITDAKSVNYCNSTIYQCIWIGSIIAWCIKFIVYLMLFISNIYISKQKQKEFFN